jgi:hypothetical protein
VRMFPLLAFQMDYLYTEHFQTGSCVSCTPASQPSPGPAVHRVQDRTADCRHAQEIGQVTSLGQKRRIRDVEQCWNWILECVASLLTHCPHVAQ